MVEKSSEDERRGQAPNRRMIACGSGLVRSGSLGAGCWPPAGYLPGDTKDPCTLGAGVAANGSLPLTADCPRGQFAGGVYFGRPFGRRSLPRAHRLAAGRHARRSSLLLCSPRGGATACCCRAPVPGVHPQG